MSDGLSTSQVAERAECSVQQVRDLEAQGVLAPAARADNGYRRFDAGHVRDLRAYQQLVVAVGPVDSRALMRRIRVVPTEEAVALISELHVRLRQETDRVQMAQRALHAIGDEPDDGGEGADAALTITDLAEALGVKASTLRFWEQEGLVSPVRVPTAAGRARSYRSVAIRQARITAALRAGGHRISDIRAALTALDEIGDAYGADAALNARRRELARRAMALLRASGVLADIIAESAADSS